jgi:hypothetical protein
MIVLQCKVPARYAKRADNPVAAGRGRVGALQLMDGLERRSAIWHGPLVALPTMTPSVAASAGVAHAAVTAVSGADCADAVARANVIGGTCVVASDDDIPAATSNIVACDTLCGTNGGSRTR